MTVAAVLHSADYADGFFAKDVRSSLLKKDITHFWNTIVRVLKFR